MRHWMMALGVLSMMCSGCGTLVLDPLVSEDQELGTGGSGPESLPFNTPNAVAMRFSQWQLLPSYTTPFELSFQNGTPDPDALVLFFSSHPQPCQQPVVQFQTSTDPAVCASQVFWQTMVALPPDLVQPGVIDLNNPDIDAYQASWMATCGGGSGNTPGIDGSLEILSLDATSATVKLVLTPHQGFPVQNGTYTATLCP